MRTFALRALFDQAHASDTRFVAGPARPDGIEKAAIDLKDDFQLPRQQFLKIAEWPFFERFGQQGVIGVAQSLLRDVPGFVPLEMRFIEQNAHQFGNGQGRMRIVELDRDLVGNEMPIAIPPVEAAYEIGHEQATRKYSWTKRNACPISVLSSG